MDLQAEIDNSLTRAANSEITLAVSHQQLMNYRQGKSCYDEASASPLHKVKTTATVFRRLLTLLLAFNAIGAITFIFGFFGPIFNSAIYIFSSALERKLQQRTPREQLINQGIMPG
jgi:hypothetical protein